MRIIGTFLIAAALALGALTAATAYHVPLSLADAELEGLRLSAPAGVDSSGNVLVPNGTVLNAEHLQTLRDAGVQRVRVAEFSASRWPGRWWFVLAVAGLGAGAWLMRTGAGRRAQASARTPTPGGQPDDHLAALASGVQRLLAELEHIPTQVKASTIIDRIDQMQRVHVTAFVAAREPLIARIGLGRYAEIMDAFAGGERQMNRAWSAAADDVVEESVQSLHRAAQRFEEALQRLGTTK